MNICSVLQRPTPSAPNFNAFSTSFGVSALASTVIVLISLTQPKNVSKSWSIPASTNSIAPSITSPVPPSNEITSSLWNTVPSAQVIVSFSRLIVKSSQPETHGLPIPFATTAACDVAPPLNVNTP